MVPDDEKPQSLVSKLGGLALIIMGFLLLAAGYRYGMGWYPATEIAFLAAGALMLGRKIVRRNQHGRTRKAASGAPNNLG